MLVGQTLADRYDILELLGSGGMGEVYRARDRELDELVALKVIRADLAGDAELVERFRREVKLARRVTHAHVARTFELGRAGDVLFCTMELIVGESLTRRLQTRGYLSSGEAVAIARAVCDGLTAAHAVGVVHRDVKPDNILIAADGRVVVADFGVAAAIVDRSDALSGTAAYMAPEQARSEPPTPAADVYAVGVVLHEMLTGARAFSGSLDDMLAAKQARDHVVTAVGGDITAELAAVIARATERDPARRLATAEALKRALAPWSRVSQPALHAPIPAQPPVAAIGEQLVVVVAPRTAGGSHTHDIVRAVHDALLDKLARTPRIRVHARTEPAGEPGTHVVTLDAAGRLTIRRLGEPAPVLELALPLDVDKVATAAATAAAAIAGIVALAAPGTPDRAGPAYALWLHARHVTQYDFASIARAVVELEEAVRLAPDDPRIVATLAMALVRHAFFVPEVRSDAVARADRLARAALVHGPDVAEAHLAMGHLELNTGDAAIAASHFRVAIARAPHLAEAHEYLGRMLLEADYPDQARARLDEALAIAPYLSAARWEFARCLALDGRWDDYDRLVADLGVNSGRAVGLARFAWWRGDRAKLAELRAGLSGQGRLFGHAMLVQMFEIYADGAWAKHEDELVGYALDTAPASQRRRAFVSQLVAEGAAAANDLDAAFRLIRHAIDNGLFDVAWLDRCPALASVRAAPEFPALRAIVKQRAEAILDALYGELELRTIADTQLASS